MTRHLRALLLPMLLVLTAIAGGLGLVAAANPPPANRPASEGSCWEFSHPTLTPSSLGGVKLPVVLRAVNDQTRKETGKESS